VHPLLQFILFAGGAFVLMALAASHLKYERMFDLIRTRPHALTPEERLDLVFAAHFKKLSGNGRSIILLLLESVPSAPQPDLEAFARPKFRAGDDLVRLADNRLAVLLEMEARHLAGVVRRLADALPAAGLPGPEAIRIGWGIYPEAGEHAADLLAVASGGLRPISLLTLPGAMPASPAEEETLDPQETRFVDPLTGVLRPEFLISESRKLIKRWRHKDRPVSLLVVSFDSGLIRERMGSAMADAALRTLGRFLTASIRETDLIGRLQNDDFLVIADVGLDQAEALGRRLIERVRIESVRADNSQIRLTLHIGLAGYPEFRGSPGELFEAAVLATAAARRPGAPPCFRYSPALQAAKPSRKSSHGERF
jgi:diguanylate cyclase (GGDEF)-like protein